MGIDSDGRLTFLCRNLWQSLLQLRSISDRQVLSCRRKFDEEREDNQPRNGRTGILGCAEFCQPASRSQLERLLESYQSEVTVSNDIVHQHPRTRMPTLVMHTTIGTLKANAIDKCSFDMPMSPALAPTINMTQEGAPEVSP